MLHGSPLDLVRDSKRKAGSRPVTEALRAIQLKLSCEGERGPVPGQFIQLRTSL